MTLLSAFFAAFAVALGAYTLWLAPSSQGRVLASGAFVALLALGWVAHFELLSLPRPAQLSTLPRSETPIEVIAARVLEDDGIYLWLQVPGEREPRYYVLPWDRNTAQQLRNAMEHAPYGLGIGSPARGGPANDDQGESRSADDDREPAFYPLPQPTLPPKAAEPPAETFRTPELTA